MEAQLRNELSVGDVVNEMMVIQTQVVGILHQAKSAQDDTAMVMAIKTCPYEDHIVAGTVIALTELTDRAPDYLLSYEDVLAAITFLDTLDIQNLRVAGK